MIKVQNNIGTITISQDYFTSLIGSTVTGCFGVVQMNISSAKQTILAGRDKLVVDLHITVLYGVNVGTVVKSIINKVKYVMEESTGISVERVNVYVDEIKT